MKFSIDLNRRVFVMLRFVLYFQRIPTSEYFVLRLEEIHFTVSLYVYRPLDAFCDVRSGCSLFTHTCLLLTVLQHHLEIHFFAWSFNLNENVLF